MATCIIQLDNFQGQYYPGNTILGKVICSLSKSINTRGIRVTLVGQEHTEWKKISSHYEQNSQKRVSNTVRVSGDNNVLEVVTTLAGEGSYPPGRYEYPFSLVLPRKLPATYIGTDGWIKYMVKAAIVIPFGFDHQDKKEFKVVAPIDFNEVPGLQLTPRTITSEKNVWWLFRSCGLITMKIYVEKEAFTLGETAKITLEITNMSTESIEKVEAQMGMETTFIATRPTEEKKEYEKMAIASDTGVGAHGERAYVFDLTVPPSTVLPNFNACKLFRRKVEITVTCVMKGIITNMVVPIEIELGDIPVRTQDQNVHSQLGSASSYSPETGAPYSPYFSDASPLPTAPRQRPPPYSEIDRNPPSQSGSPSHLYPVISKHGPVSETYPPLPQPRTSPPESTNPSAPAKEDLQLDDDFVLV